MPQTYLPHAAALARPGYGEVVTTTINRAKK
jgi:hypothetical protein